MRYFIRRKAIYAFLLVGTIVYNAYCKEIILEEKSISNKTSIGAIKFPGDYLDKWFILFNHTISFMPVRLSEFVSFTYLSEIKTENNEIEENPDEYINNFARLRTIKKKGLNKYSFNNTSKKNENAARGIFFNDPNGKVKALVYHPFPGGCNSDEFSRLLKAMKTADKYRISTPVDCRAAEDIVGQQFKYCDYGKQKKEKVNTDYYCLDWFFVFMNLEKSR